VVQVKTTELRLPMARGRSDGFDSQYRRERRSDMICAGGEQDYWQAWQVFQARRNFNPVMPGGIDKSTVIVAYPMSEQQKWPPRKGGHFDQRCAVTYIFTDDP